MRAEVRRRDAAVRGAPRKAQLKQMRARDARARVLDA